MVEEDSECFDFNTDDTDEEEGLLTIVKISITIFLLCKSNNNHFIL